MIPSRSRQVHRRRIAYVIEPDVRGCQLGQNRNRNFAAASSDNSDLAAVCRERIDCQILSLTMSGQRIT